MTPQKIDQRMDFLFRMAQDAPGANRRTDGWQARLTAGLWVKNELIAVGWNMAKSHPLQKRFPKRADYDFMHAEINTIRQALKRYSEVELKRMKTTLMIVRAKKQGANKSPWVWGMARPCPGCTAAINHFQIDRVIWSENTDDGFGDPHWCEYDRREEGSLHTHCDHE